MLLIFLALLTHYTQMPGLPPLRTPSPHTPPSIPIHSSLLSLESAFLKVVVNQFQKLRTCPISVILEQCSAMVESSGYLSSSPGFSDS